MKMIVHGIMLLSATLLTAAQVARAEPIYREVFGRASGGSGTSIAPFDWYANLVSGGAGHPLFGVQYSPHVSDNFLIWGGSGRPDDLPNVNAGGVAVSETYGLAYRKPLTYADNRSVMWTEEYVVDRSQWDLESISFYSNNDSLGGNLRVVVRVDGGLAGTADDVWVVSSEMFNSSGGTPTNFSTNAVQHVLNFSTATWQSLTFVPNYTATIGPGSLGTPGSSTPFPNGDITAFGLYMPPSNQILRVDTYQIDATPVPEPAGLSLLILGLIGLGRFRRRKA